MPDSVDNILTQAVTDGLAAHGKTATVDPVVTQQPAPVVNTPPPQITPAVPEVKPAPNADDDKVSLDDFKPAFEKMTPAKVETKTPDNKVEVKVETPTTPSRDAVLKELGIPAEKLERFKRMPNDTFDEVVSVIRARNELDGKYKDVEGKLKVAEEAKSKIPTNYYEHPEGYALLPEVRKAYQQNSMVQVELKHWEEQFQRIESGEDWEDMDYDAKGNLVKTKMQGNPQAKLAVLGYIQNAKGILQQNNQYLDNVKGQWSNYHRQYVQSFEQAADQYFPQFKGKSDNQYINTMTKLLAERGQGHNPLNPLFARMYAALMDTNAKLQQYEAQAKAGTQVSAQPPSSAINGSGANNSGNDDIVRVSDFDAVINRR